MWEFAHHLAIYLAQPALLPIPLHVQVVLLATHITQPLHHAHHLLAAGFAQFVHWDMLFLVKELVYNAQ
jgi:hypothetical protein